MRSPLDAITACQNQLERHPWSRFPRALALLCTLPSLWNGLAVDDYTHALMLDGGGFERMLVAPAAPPSGSTTAEGRGPARNLDLFRFVSADPEQVARIRARGILPWFVADELHLAFWRPVSAFTHLVDAWLWPDRPAFAHAHSLIWFALLLALAASVYRQLSPTPTVALLALTLYALDDARAIPVGWVANRNALVSAVFALAAFRAYIAPLPHRSRVHQLAGPALLGVALLGGEAALGVLGYMVAHALFLETSPTRLRLARLAPYLLTVVAWRVLYTALGYGARGSGLYIDPLANPLRFMGAVLERLPVLLAAQLTLPLGDLSAFLSGAGRWALLASSLTLLALVGVALRGRIVRTPLQRFWLTGMGLSAIPVCATFPNERLLILVGLGGMGLIALLIAELWGATSNRSVASNRAAPRLATRERFAAIALVGVHLVLSPLHLPLRVSLPGRLDTMLERASDQLPADVSIGRQTLILLNPPDFFYSSQVLLRRAALAEPLPARMHGLVFGTAGLSTTRIDERTLEARIPGGMFRTPWDQLLHDGRPMQRASGFSSRASPSRWSSSRATAARRRCAFASSARSNTRATAGSPAPVRATSPSTCPRRARSGGWHRSTAWRWPSPHRQIRSDRLLRPAAWRTSSGPT